MELKLVEQNETVSGEKKEQEKRNPWDYEGMPQGEQEYSIKRTIQREDDDPEDGEDGRVVFWIGEILMYISLGLTILSFVVICFLPQIDILYNTLKIIIFPYIFMGVTFADSILVNALRKKKKTWSLVLVSIFFVVFYPIIRNKNVRGKHGLATFFVIGYIVSCIIYGICFYHGNTNYSMEAMMVPDAKLRSQVAALMDQPTESGARLGKSINSNLLMENISMEINEEEQYLILEGIGFITYDESSFYSSDATFVDTKLVFWLNENGEYEIYNVELDEAPLPATKIESYMTIISMP